MPRELLEAEVKRQAAACLEYVRRGGDLTLWLDSKAFDPEDRAAIVREVAGRRNSDAAREAGQEG